MAITPWMGILIIQIHLKIPARPFFSGKDDSYDFMKNHRTSSVIMYSEGNFLIPELFNL